MAGRPSPLIVRLTLERLLWQSMSSRTWCAIIAHDFSLVKNFFPSRNAPIRTQTSIDYSANRHLMWCQSNRFRSETELWHPFEVGRARLRLARFAMSQINEAGAQPLVSGRAGAGKLATLLSRNRPSKRHAPEGWRSENWHKMKDCGPQEGWGAYQNRHPNSAIPSRLVRVSGGIWTNRHDDRGITRP